MNAKRVAAALTAVATLALAAFAAIACIFVGVTTQTRADAAAARLRVPAGAAIVRTYPDLRRYRIDQYRQDLPQGYAGICLTSSGRTWLHVRTGIR